jgi:hypothetical protein
MQIEVIAVRANRIVNFDLPMNDAGVKPLSKSHDYYRTDHTVIKTVFDDSQVRAVEGPKPLQVLKHIVKYEGIRGLWRGTSAGISHALPSVSIYLTCYEQMKIWLDRSTNVRAEFIPSFAGGISRFCAVMITCPLEVARIRLMASGKRKFSGPDGKSVIKKSPNPATSFDILLQLVKVDGVRSLWKGLVPMLWRDVPFSSIYWGLAERIRKFLLVSPALART